MCVCVCVCEWLNEGCSKEKKLLLRSTGPRRHQCVRARSMCSVGLSYEPTAARPHFVQTNLRAATFKLCLHVTAVIAAVLQYISANSPHSLPLVRILVFLQIQVKLCPLCFLQKSCFGKPRDVTRAFKSSLWAPGLIRKTRSPSSSHLQRRGAAGTSTLTAGYNSDC